MKAVTINLPDTIADLYSKVGEKLFLSTLRVAVDNLIEEERQSLLNIQIRIQGFEKKYKSNFEEYEQNFPADANYQMHEDYGEWSYLNDVQKAIEKDIQTYQKLRGGEK